MSVFESIGLAAAQRLERSVGPSVALRSYKALLGGDRAVARQAVGGAFRCALALRDAPELHALCAYWETLKALDAFDDIAALCVELCAEDRTAEAAILAASEVGRSGSGQALYLYARVLEECGEDAEPAYRRAVAVAQPDVAAAAAGRVIELASARGAERSDLAAFAQGIDLSRASPAQRLTAAMARLCAPSRFSRAAALSILDELAGGPDDAVAAHAIIAAAKHADEMGEGLSGVEAERVVTALRRWKDPTARDAALGRIEARRRIAACRDQGAGPGVRGVPAGPGVRGVPAGPGAEAALEGSIADACSADRAHLAHLEHARATLAGYACENDATAAGELALAKQALDALAAAHSAHAADNGDRVLEPLARLRVLLSGPDAPVPLSAWSAVLVALDGSDERIRRAAVELLALLLPRARAPRQGFTAVAHAARRAGADDLALAALRRAAAAGEPEGRTELAAELAARGWHAAARGGHDEALALLRNARALGEPAKSRSS